MLAINGNGVQYSAVCAQAGKTPSGIIRPDKKPLSVMYMECTPNIVYGEHARQAVPRRNDLDGGACGVCHSRRLDNKRNKARGHKQQNVVPLNSRQPEPENRRKRAADDYGQAEYQHSARELADI